MEGRQAVLQQNYRESGRKQPRSRCVYLGRNPDEARERLLELVEDPAKAQALADKLEATWSPAAEARRYARQIDKLWERAEHPVVRTELAYYAAMLDKLAGDGVVSKIHDTTTGPHGWGHDRQGPFPECS